MFKSLKKVFAVSTSALMILTGMIAPANAVNPVSAQPFTAIAEETTEKCVICGEESPVSQMINIVSYKCTNCYYNEEVECNVCYQVFPRANTHIGPLGIRKCDNCYAKNPYLGTTTSTFNYHNTTTETTTTTSTTTDSSTITNTTTETTSASSIETVLTTSEAEYWSPAGTAIYMFSSVETYPTKTVYEQGEEFDVSGLVINIYKPSRWRSNLGNFKTKVYNGTCEITSLDEGTLDVISTDGTVYKTSDFPVLEPGKYKLQTQPKNNTIFCSNIDGYADYIYYTDFSYSIVIKENDMTSGKCGDEISWLLDNNGTLLIFGNGKMDDYSDSSKSPFYNNTDIKTIEIDDGIDYIGEFTFENCPNLKEIIIPESVEQISSYAFNDLNENLIIYGNENSYAQQFAEENEIKFVLYGTEEPETNEIKGDSNGDGEINMADAVIIMQSLANPDKYGVNGSHETHLTEQGMNNADINGDGLTNADALEIQKYVLKIIDIL